MEDKLKLLVENQAEVLKFLKGKFPLFHNSNVFFRDLHYGIMAYLEQNRIGTKYLEAEAITQKFIEHLESTGILRKIDNTTWMLHYEEFRKPPVKPAPPARPAASPSATPGTPKPATSRPTAAAPAQPAQPATQPRQQEAGSKQDVAAGKVAE